MTLRVCRVCGSIISKGHPRIVTCGHPRCVRTNRNQRPPSKARNLQHLGTAERERRQGVADTVGRERIAVLMRGAVADGVPVRQAVEAVARATGETVAVVVSVWWATGGVA